LRQSEAIRRSIVEKYPHTLVYSEEMAMESLPVPTDETDPITLGLRIRHFRVQRGLTLEQLGLEVGVVASQLSLIENGHREPRLSLLKAIARTLDVSVPELLSNAAPSPRAALEIELDRIQRGPLYSTLGLPSVRAGKTLPDSALEAII
jgi:transcriptional regulator with XRE-family HTH domain